MNHIQPFQSRDVASLPVAERNGWLLKRYAILAEGKAYGPNIVSAAFDYAIDRLPTAGSLEDQGDNHAIGFQIIHFAEVAVVSSVFFWQWGSVLASIQQIRAPWNCPTKFDTGMEEVVGCVWEMEVVNFEVNAWTNIMLGNTGTPRENLANYLECRLPSARSLAQNS